jgi:NAD+ synthase
MNRIKDYTELTNKIVSWLTDYATSNNIKSFVIGVSGGIDSAVSSTLAALTGLPVYALGMPIHQKEEQETLSDSHLAWLEQNFDNVTVLKYNLTNVFDTFKDTMGEYGTDAHSLANTRSRIRMVTLYQVATSVRGIVVGTGNKVEDYGVGFYTKYGDGGVDIAPIADLYKSEVWELGRQLCIDNRIIEAAPTDGLWDDGRTDEEQIGTSYEMLEWVMERGQYENPTSSDEKKLKAVMAFNKFHNQNKHKMVPIPTFTLN